MVSMLLAALVATPPGGALAIEQPTVDVGEVRAERMLVHTFRVRNAASEPVIITEAAAPCACARVAWDRRPILPGASADVQVAINPLAQPEGNQSWTTTIRYRSASATENTGEARLTIRARVRREIVIEPVAVLLATEGEMSASVVITDRRPRPLTVTRARLGLPGVDVQVHPAAIDSAGQRRQVVDVTVRSNCPPGQHADELALDTDDPDCRELRVPIRVLKKAARGSIEVVPAEVNLRFAEEQRTAASLVRLRARDGRAVVVDQVRCEHAAVACKWASGPGEFATVRIQVERDQAALSGSTVVTIRVKEPVEETILLPVTWRIPYHHK